MKEIIIDALKRKILGWTPETQYASLIHIIIINEIFCLRVFESKGRLRYDWSIIYASICIILYTICTNEIININYKNWPAYQEISYKLTIYINIISVIIFIIFGMLNTERSRRIITKCEQLDNTLESFGIKKNYKKTFFQVMQILIIANTIMISMILIKLFHTTSKEKKQKFDLTILIYIIMGTMYLGIFTFIIFVSILHDKLHKMNKLIKEVYELSDTKDIDIRYEIQLHIAHKFIIIMDYYNRKHFVQHFLQVIRYVHFEILKLSRELNQAYTYQILFELIMQFSLLLCTFYNEYFHLISLKLFEALSDKQNIEFLIWICLFSTKFIYINNQCTKFYCEVEVTVYLLRKLDICYLDNFIRDEVQQVLLQLFLHPLKFTAGGYILNNKLSTMFFGTIISYLVVLIQISSSPSLMKLLSKSL